MMVRIFLLLCSAMVFLGGCDRSDDGMPPIVMTDRRRAALASCAILPTGSRMLALGDSYTIGEHSKPEDRWPVQLAAQLKLRKEDLGDASILAHTGWITGELLGAIDGAHFHIPYRLVLVQIGVNDQYQEVPLKECQKQFETVLDRAVTLAGDDSRGVVVVSIPDYGVTPFGQRVGGAEISHGIAEFNVMEQQVCSRRHIAYVDITPESQDARNDPSLLASDQLHPSVKMYSAWVDLMLPAVQKALER